MSSEKLSLYDLDHVTLETIMNMVDIKTVISLKNTNRELRNIVTYLDYNEENIIKMLRNFENLEILKINNTHNSYIQISDVISGNQEIEDFKFDRDDFKIFKNYDENMITITSKKGLKNRLNDEIYHKISFKVDKYIMKNNLIKIIKINRSIKYYLIFWDKFILICSGSYFICTQISKYPIKSVIYYIDLILLIDKNNQCFAINTCNTYRYKVYRNGKILIINQLLPNYNTIEFTYTFYLTDDTFYVYYFDQNTIQTIRKLITDKKITEIYDIYLKNQSSNFSISVDKIYENKPIQETQKYTNVDELIKHIKSEKFDDIEI
jgi:hypothetical protein